MPLIDVTDILSDPEIAGEAFTVIRRAENVNTFGESVTKNTTFQAVGSIQPTGDNSLVREEAYQSQNKTIQVITQFRLRGDARDSTGQMYQPDIVKWKGDCFLVKAVDDYSQYGAGMVIAECVSQDFDDAPPT